jgi:Protein of unknown function (DUF3224)
VTAFVLGLGLLVFAQTVQGPAASAEAWRHLSSTPRRRLTMADKHKLHAIGQTAVKTYQPTAFDEAPGGPTLSDIRVTETFSGDIAGDGVAHVVQAARTDGTATFAGIERVRGSVGGKPGSFLLQVHGTVVGKEMKAEWFVLSGSGTGELKGLRGEGGFKAELGRHGAIWLDYDL